MTTASSHRCLLTYGSSGKTITYAMCNENNIMHVDQCYTLVQRDLKYTLLHVKKRITRPAITNLMLHFDRMYGIKSAAVFGYEAVSIGDEIDDHPGMAMIIECAKKNTDVLETWVTEGNIRTYKRGLLYYHLTGFEVQDMTRKQLLNHVKELKSTLEESKAKIVELESSATELDELRRLVKRYKRRLDIQEHVFIYGGRAQELLPPSP